MSLNRKYVPLKERVIISVTPCGRPGCTHAICRAYWAWQKEWGAEEQEKAEKLFANP